MKPTKRLGPWPVGMDNASAATGLARDRRGNLVALADACNVTIDRDGHPRRRGGRSLAVTLAGAHSFWSGDTGAFCAAAGKLYAVDAGSATEIATLQSDDPVGYAVLNDTTIASNRTTLLRIANGSATPLAIPDASAPSVTASAAGGLEAGTYCVAVAFVRDGVEGGLSALRRVTLADGQGIALAAIPAATGCAVRVYRTRPDGETLANAADVAPGIASMTLGTGPLGRNAATQDLREMPPGRHVAAWRGRLLVARGNVLRASEPMAYHLHSPRHGFVQFAERIGWIAPVEGGVFVGLRTGVKFLRGARPAEWVQDTTGAAPPAGGSAVPIDGGILDPEYGLGGQRCALWLGARGFALGTPAGQVIEPQATRITLAPPAHAHIAIHGRHAFAAVA